MTDPLLVEKRIEERSDAREDELEHMDCLPYILYESFHETRIRLLALEELEKSLRNPKK